MTMTDSRIWILGAPDPEMEMIERTLRECGETVAYALDERGERVMPATAYRAHCPDLALDRIRSRGGAIYLVECDLADARFGTHSPEYTDCSAVVIRIDHHRPGDPGYGRPPSEFLAASSVGQVIAELAKRGRLPESWDTIDGPLDEPGVFVFEARDIGEPAEWMVAIEAHAFSAEDGGEPDFDCATCAIIPRDLVLTAAADHCLGAAYAGECPGVDPDALMRWRAESRAKFQGRTVEDVLADVEMARESLRRAPTVVLDGVSPRRKREEGCPAEASRAFCVRDMRGVCTAHRLDHDCGCATQQCVTLCGAYAHGPCSVPELPDAASRDGEAYVTTVTVDGSGHPCRPKVVLGGCTTPDMVRAFLDHWAPAQGLVDAYGDPERGFAGAYLPEEVAS